MTSRSSNQSCSLTPHYTHSTTQQTAIYSPTRRRSTMYRPPSKNQSRAPSRNMARLGHQPLVIRTTNPSTQPANQPGSSSSPPQQPYPTYPIPIPPEKHAKALKIYIQYRYEEGLEQRRAEQATAMGNHDGSHLGVPGPPTLYSIASYSSAGHTATSIATSAYEEGQVTDMSSLMSFTDNESPSSAKARAEAELTAFNGSKVKQRVRKKLSPKAKAKAALVRWLGSCWVCRSRRVPVSCFIMSLHYNSILTLSQVSFRASRYRKPRKCPTREILSTSITTTIAIVEFELLATNCREYTSKTSSLRRLSGGVTAWIGPE